MFVSLFAFEKVLCWRRVKLREDFTHINAAFLNQYCKPYFFIAQELIKEIFYPFQMKKLFPFSIFCILKKNQYFLKKIWRFFEFYLGIFLLYI